MFLIINFMNAYMFSFALLCLTHQVKSLTLFVTHYPVLAQLETTFPGTVGNFHMAYVEAETTS